MAEALRDRLEQLKWTMVTEKVDVGFVCMELPSLPLIARLSQERIVGWFYETRRYTTMRFDGQNEFPRVVEFDLRICIAIRWPGGVKVGFTTRQLGTEVLLRQPSLDHHAFPAVFLASWFQAELRRACRYAPRQLLRTLLQLGWHRPKGVRPDHFADDWASRIAPDRLNFPWGMGEANAVLAGVPDELALTAAVREGRAPIEAYHDWLCEQPGREAEAPLALEVWKMLHPPTRPTVVQPATRGGKTHLARQLAQTLAAQQGAPS